MCLCEKVHTYNVKQHHISTTSRSSVTHHGFHLLHGDDLCQGQAGSAQQDIFGKLSVAMPDLYNQGNSAGVWTINISDANINYKSLGVCEEAGYE